MLLVAGLVLLVAGLVLLVADLVLLVAGLVLVVAGLVLLVAGLELLFHSRILILSTCNSWGPTCSGEPMLVERLVGWGQLL